MSRFTVKQLRLAKEISQESMAEKLGIHVNTYAEWEKNPSNISIKNAKIICELLGEEFDYVIFLPETSTNM